MYVYIYIFSSECCFACLRQSKNRRCERWALWWAHAKHDTTTRSYTNTTCKLCPSTSPMQARCCLLNKGQVSRLWLDKIKLFSLDACYFVTLPETVIKLKYQLKFWHFFPSRWRPFRFFRFDCKKRRRPNRPININEHNLIVGNDLVASLFFRLCSVCVFFLLLPVFQWVSSHWTGIFRLH